jgi:phosphoserine aminotransferase
MKSIVVVPTYNEAENIPLLAEQIARAIPEAHLLLMDDNSPDGTANAAERLFASQSAYANYRVVRRTGPRGLGRAYRDGFQHALRADYDLIVQMDADLSHDPAYLPALMEATMQADLIIGSRYCPGGGVRNWPQRRLWLSRFACWYVQKVARIPVADVTAGYRCWTRRALQAVQLETLQSEGYSFQVEMSHRAWRAGMRLAEVPIIFTDRQFGRSKISRAVLIESFLIPWRLRWRPWHPDNTAFMRWRQREPSVRRRESSDDSKALFRPLRGKKGLSLQWVRFRFRAILPHNGVNAFALGALDRKEEENGMRRIYNFSAGPAILPVPVLEEASRGVLEINGSGMSILEVSHRGKDYEAIHFDSHARVLRVLGLSPEAYTVLFLGGGASLQFAMLPMNFLREGQTADYVHTGEWAIKAIKEAMRFGTVNVAATSEESKFSCIPKTLNLTPGAQYVHITTNNTIEGTEWAALPDTGAVPLVADASSDIFARALDYSRFHLFYAGAQKNAGPAGVTLVVARRDYLDRAADDIGAALSYKTHAKADSLYNTPPAFAVYVVGLVMKWVEEQGGLSAIEQRNCEKAAIIYNALDAHLDVYDPAVTDKADRSLMNVTFRLKNADLEKAFLAGAQKRDMDGLKGHRSVGGFRASIYNAFPVEGCRALADYIHEFAALQP